MNRKQLFFLGLGIAAIIILMVLPPWRGKVYCPYQKLTFLGGVYNYENWYKKLLWEGGGKREWVGLYYRYTKDIEHKTPLALEYEQAVKSAWEANKAMLGTKKDGEFFPLEQYPELYRNIVPYHGNPQCQRMKLTGINYKILAGFGSLVVLVTTGFIYTSRSRTQTGQV